MEARMMKNDLTCGVVRDLLPSYVENLLGEESREAVERHLEGCPDCTAKKEAMTAPTGAEETAEAGKEAETGEAETGEAETGKEAGAGEAAPQADAVRDETDV